MVWRSPYPHGADLSIYPNVATMCDAYLDARYRDYPRGAHVPLGPWPENAARGSARVGIDWIDVRPRCHAIVVVSGKVVVLRFARRATLADIERLVEERALIPSTPELAALSSWRIDARLVYCDAFDGIKDAAALRSIHLALYSPRLLLRWRDRAGRLPGEGIHALNFSPEALRNYVALHARRRGRIRQSACSNVGA